MLWTTMMMGTATLDRELLKSGASHMPHGMVRLRAALMLVAIGAAVAWAPVAAGQARDGTTKAATKKPAHTSCSLSRTLAAPAVAA